MLTSTGEPSTISEALGDPKWQQAMQEEYNALLQNKTWHLVPPSPDKNLIACKWAYRIKKNADGTVERYRACLDYSQRVPYQKIDVSIKFGLCLD
jgi:hypothetical protein